MTTQMSRQQADSQPPFSLKEWMMQKGSREDASDAPSFPKVLLLDGGVSTHLERSGAIFENRRLWSSSLLLADEGRERVRNGHKDWIRRGRCNVVSTVTYQCHFGTYRNSNPVLPDGAMAKLMADGVRLAREAVEEAKKEGSSRPLFTVVSSGCFGAALANGAEYTGEYGDVTDEELCDFHGRKLDCYLDQKFDGIAIETIPSLRECECVCRVLQNYKVDEAAVWISFSCRNGSQLRDGSDLADALSILHESDPGADMIHGIGVNCCHGQHLASLVDVVRRHPCSERRALVVYPNSGESWDANREAWKEGTAWGGTPREFATKLWESVAVFNDVVSGPLILGGCCRTSPEAISALREIIEGETGCQGIP